MKRKNLISGSFNLIPKSQKEILEIKRSFLLSDIKHKDNVLNNYNPDLDFKENRINAHVLVGISTQVNKDEYGFEDKEEVLEYDVVDVEFLMEFKEALEIKFNNYCDKFLIELDKKSVYTVEKLEGFKKRQLHKVNKRITYLNTMSDIENDIKNIIIDFFNKLYDFISNFKLEDSQVGNKLKFKLSKNQLIWLFHTMHAKEVIKGIAPNDLYRILEFNTMYYDNGKYEDMTGVRIQANKLINGNSSPEKSIKELSRIFDKNFFTTSE